MVCALSRTFKQISESSACFLPPVGGKLRAGRPPATYNQRMKLPKLEKPDRYQGLYVFDFGDHAGVGFTAEEVAELLDSERYKEGKAYKIQRAFPDGRMELRAVPAATSSWRPGCSSTRRTRRRPGAISSGS